MIEVIPLKYGRAFKRAFSQPAVFNSFVSDVLGIPIHVDTVYSEYEYKKPVGFVKSRYDLFAQDPKNRLVIEIQQAKEGDFFERFFYYHMISLIEQVPDYSIYWFTETVYTIVILTSVPRDGSIKFSYAVQDLSLLDEYNQRLNIYPHRLIFLTPRLVNKHTPPLLRAWLELIKDSLDGKMEESLYKREPFPSILESIRSSTFTPEDLAEIKNDAVWESMQQSIREEAREEGKAEGLAEGEARGLAEGEAKGLTKGKAELLQRLLTQRFGNLPQWAKMQLNAASIPQLDAWAEAIFTAPNLDTMLSNTLPSTSPPCPLPLTREGG